MVFKNINNGQVANITDNDLIAIYESDKDWTKGSKTDLPENPVFFELNINQQRIAKLKTNLAATDYQAIKYAEGLISEADYAPIKIQRQSWRDEINKLEIKNK